MVSRYRWPGQAQAQDKAQDGPFWDHPGLSWGCPGLFLAVLAYLVVILPHLGDVLAHFGGPNIQEHNLF